MALIKFVGLAGVLRVQVKRKTEQRNSFAVSRKKVSSPSWEWVVMANVLLGLQQGLCWTTLINMMLDPARPASRGLGTGVNEFAGYVGVATAVTAAQGSGSRGRAGARR